ncbi:MAG: hypothetical protein NT040_13230 [Bacteroidetes bacterium]|nr:hypothetical protein [Bacteroidota bacterium]
MRTFLKLALPLLLILAFLSLKGQQKEEPLNIYKCDTLADKELIWSISPYPPVLKIKKEMLEEHLTSKLNYPSNDSTIVLIVWTVINCDSTAKYDFTLKGANGKHPELGNQLITILKEYCTWSPGKSRVEFTKTILKHENGKVVHLKQYTHYLARFGIGLKFNIRRGKVTLVSEVKTIH